MFSAAQPSVSNAAIYISSLMSPDLLYLIVLKKLYNLSNRLSKNLQSNCNCSKAHTAIAEFNILRMFSTHFETKRSVFSWRKTSSSWSFGGVKPDEITFLFASYYKNDFFDISSVTLINSQKDHENKLHFVLF